MYCQGASEKYNLQNRDLIPGVIYNWSITNGAFNDDNIGYGLDSVEVTTIALECKKLKQKEDEVTALEEQLKNKKAEVDDISSRVIP